MKAMHKLVWLAALLGCLVWRGSPLHAQGVSPALDGGEALHSQQLAAEREALVTMLNDGNTPAERRVSIQRLLEWNARGLTFTEVKKLNAAALAPAIPPPANNLAEAEAAPLPANVNMGSGALLHNFSKGRDAEASSRAASSLGLVKTQQEMENATRESEAKLRDAQQVRNSAGAAALAQRQQETAGAASQQAAGGMGSVLGDSLVQSVQQGAQAAGQAIGGGAAGRMGSVAGSSAAGGGGGGGEGGDMTGGAAPALGASAAAGQIFGGGGVSSPAAAPAANVPQPDGQVTAPVSANMEAAADMSAMRSAAKRVYVPNSRYQTDGKPYLPPRSAYQTEGRPAIPNTRPAERDRRIAQPLGKPGVMDGVADNNPRHNLKPANAWTAAELKGMGEKTSGEPMHWVQSCPRHGKYSGTGALTGCPKCVGYIR